MLDLFGTAYLGLQRCDRYVEIACEGMRSYGVANPFGRDSDYDFGPLVQAEMAVAKEFVQEAACLFSSGFIAGNATRRLLGRVSKEEDMGLAVASDIHPCFSLGGFYGLPQSDGDTISFVERKNRRWIAVFEPLNSLLGTRTLDVEKSMIIERAAVRAIDVSHTAFLWNHANLIGVGETLFYGSLGKAAAFPVGFAAGPRRLIDRLRGDPAYRTSYPPANALAYAFLHSDDLRRERHKKLRKLLAIVDASLGLDRGTAWFPAYYLTDQEEIYLGFLKDGIRLSCVRYPSETATPMVRAVVHAGLQLGDIECFLSQCRRKGIHPPMPKTKVEWRVASEIRMNSCD